MALQKTFLSTLILLLSLLVSSPAKAEDFSGKRDIAMLTAGGLTVSLLVLVVWAAVTDSDGPNQEETKKDTSLSQNSIQIPKKISQKFNLPENWMKQDLRFEEAP